MQLAHAETLTVRTENDTDGYRVVYTVNAAGEKHGVEYTYYPGGSEYSSICHYINGVLGGPILWFNRDGTIPQIMQMTAPHGSKPTLDEVRTYTVTEDTD